MNDKIGRGEVEIKTDVTLNDDSSGTGKTDFSPVDLTYPQNRV